jgi:hypothetical protein
MKTVLVLVLTGLAGAIHPMNAVDYYKLPDIKRLDKDVYRSASVIIETRFCHHATTGEQALLKYEGPGEYQVIWADHSTCDVEKVVELEKSNTNLASKSKLGSSPQDPQATRK